MYYHLMQPGLQIQNLRIFLNIKGIAKRHSIYIHLLPHQHQMQTLPVYFDSFLSFPINSQCFKEAVYNLDFQDLIIEETATLSFRQ